MAGEHVESEAAGHRGVGHVVPVRILAATGITLLILTGITVWAASLDLGGFNNWIALSIAVVQASLAMLYLGHLRYDRPFNAIVLVAALAFVALFISFALTDTREYAPNVEPGDAPLVEQKLTETGQ
jgi:cytochrome c oxidase subunit 4